MTKHKKICFLRVNEIQAKKYMNTKQLKYVLVLAKEGSFSRAAESLNISQPSLSQYIKKIEKNIGLELFDRTNGEVRLTDAGHAYLDAGRKIIDLEHQLEVTFSDLATNKTGSLIIGTTPYRAVSIMPEIARYFQERYPGMHLVVREATTAELLEGMLHGGYDLCLTLLPTDECIFQWEKVVEEEAIIAVPATYPLFETYDIPDRKYPAINAEVLNNENKTLNVFGKLICFLS